MMTKPLMVMMSPELHEKIKQEAGEREISASALARLAILEKLEVKPNGA